MTYVEHTQTRSNSLYLLHNFTRNIYII